MERNSEYRKMVSIAIVAGVCASQEITERAITFSLVDQRESRNCLELLTRYTVKTWRVVRMGCGTKGLPLVALPVVC
jgi:hypothetical protein